jgi:ABC-type multidrug transport system fused ATPase/permease subunit
MHLYKHIRLSWTLLSRRVKGFIIFSSSLSIFSAFLDIIGISFIFPIVKILIDDDFFNSNQIIIQIKELINIDDRSQFVMAALIGLVLLLIVKSIYALALQYWINQSLAKAEVNFSQSLFKAYLSAPLSFLHSRNSAELLRNVYSSVPQLFNNSAYLMIQLIAETALIFGLLIVLMVASPSASLAAATLIVCAMIIFILAFSQRISRLAIQSHDLVKTSNRVVLESLEGVEEIRVLGCENFFFEKFQNLRREVARVSVAFKTISQVPRYYLEILISLILVIVVFQFIDDNNGSEATAVLALYGVAAMRMMPAATRIMGMLNQAKFSIPAVQQLAEDVDRFGSWIIGDEISKNVALEEQNGSAKLSRDEKIKFQQKFEMNEISFHYDDGPQVLKNISFDFNPGQAIGFVGSSGAGKSTIIAIILGLLPPQSGIIMVDGSNTDLGSAKWQQNLGYVPQQIFLLDDTIQKNIAFGIPPEVIDDEKILKAAQGAQLVEFIAALPEGFNTVVGERGVRLSGGQRQRIGIARALYNDPDILIFDEATSALDVETETQITDVLHKLRGDKTLIIVAHRLSTIQECDKIIFMEDGEILDSGTFSELETNCNKFHQLIKLARLSSSSSIN